MSTASEQQSYGVGSSSSGSGSSIPLRKGAACRSCRVRKRKCDGVLSGCSQCSSRITECVYDPEPKRRGPDRNPGLRNRFPNGTRKSRPSARAIKDSSEGPQRPVITTQKAGRCRSPAPSQEERTDMFMTAPERHTAYASQCIVTITSDPSLHFHRLSWWDDLLSMYSSDRNLSSRLIATDLSILFRSNSQLRCFIHVPLFFGAILTSAGRENIQAPLVLAALAFSTLIQSPAAPDPHQARQKALTLQSAAISSYDAAIQAMSISPALAQAGIILAMFEQCPHPEYSEERQLSSLRRLDSTIRALSLTIMDLDNPDSSVFPREMVPALFPPDATMNSEPASSSCTCGSLSRDAFPHGHAVGWLGWPPWDETWSEATINQELGRRICWSALRIIARYISFHAVFAERNTQPSHDFFVAQASNYALLFPGEAPSSYHSLITGTQSSKDTVWALNYRAILLYCSCASLYAKPIDDQAYAFFVSQTLLEAGRIETALDKHSCQAEAHNDWVGRHMLRDIRISVLFDVKRYLSDAVSVAPPIEVSEQFVNELRNIIVMMGKRSTPSDSRQAPFLFWFLLRMLRRCVRLWELDHTLIAVIDFGQRLAYDLEFLLGIFPSQGPQESFKKLQHRLDVAWTLCEREPEVPLKGLFTSG